MMTRMPFLLGILLVSGCGESERPRFVPASAVEPASSSADRKSGEGASREATTPKNIPMH